MKHRGMKKVKIRLVYLCIRGLAFIRSTFFVMIPPGNRIDSLVQCGGPEKNIGNLIVLKRLGK